MRHLAITLALLLITLFGSGCATTTTDQIVYMPQKCHVELSQMPSVEQCKFEKKEDALSWGQCSYKNYLVMKEHTETIRVEAKVCE